MVFTFLAIALGILLLPLIFHLHKRSFVENKLKFTVGASLVAAMLMSTIYLVLVKFNVIAYKAENSNDLHFGGVPIAQYILHFTFSFTIIGTYNYLNLLFPKNDLQKYSLAISHFLLGLCIAFLFFGYTKLFAVVTFSTLFLFLFAVEYMSKLRFMYKTYRTFLIMLIPGFAIYSILIAEGILKINHAETVGINLLGVPLEQCFVVLLNTVVAVNMFEFFKAKNRA